MRKFLGVGIALMLVLAFAAPAVAAGKSATYHGTITGAEFRCNGEPLAMDRSVTGTWSMNVTGNYGVVTVHAWYDGAHHTSFGMSHGAATLGEDVVTIDYYGGYADGGLSAAIEEGSFSWDVDLGVECPADNDYNTLTYFGELTK